MPNRRIGAEIAQSEPKREQMGEQIDEQMGEPEGTSRRARMARLERADLSQRG